MKGWKHKASCRYHDPSLFDVERLRGPGAEARMKMREQSAKEICSTCPVLEECRLYGLEVAVTYDAIEQIYGGLTPRELADLVGTKTKYISGVLTFRDGERHASDRSGQRKSGEREEAAL